MCVCENIYYLPVRGTGIKQLKHLRNILHMKDLTLKLKSLTKLLFTTMVYVNLLAVQLCFL